MVKKEDRHCSIEPTDSLPNVSLGPREKALLRYLYDNQGSRFNVSDYSTEIGIPRSSVYEILSGLKRKNLAYKPHDGNHKISPIGNEFIKAQERSVGQLQKKVQIPRRCRNLKLSIYSDISKGLSLSEISKNRGLKPSALSYHIKHLKASGAISKVGYGVWEANEIKSEQLQKSAVRPPLPFIIADSPKRLKKEIRGHAFRVWVRLPKLKRWDERRVWMEKKDIKFKRIPHGESIEVRGHRVKIFSRSLDVYFSKEWSLFGEDAEVSFKYAMLEFNSILTAFKNLFNIDLGRKFEFRVLREHYGIVRNALAKDYLFRGEKLQVFDDDGKLWLLIDNSHHMEECETVKTGTARDDNRKVQDWFNGVKKTGITPEFILQGFDNLIKDRAYFAENQRTHIEVLGELKDAIRELKGEVKKK